MPSAAGSAECRFRMDDCQDRLRALGGASSRRFDFAPHRAVIRSSPQGRALDGR